MFVDENHFQLRKFIDLTESYVAVPEVEEDGITTHAEEEKIDESVKLLLADLDQLVFKLRGFMETEGGDYALGVETGMQRAAEMIENVMHLHSEGRQSLG